MSPAKNGRARLAAARSARSRRTRWAILAGAAVLVTAVVAVLIVVVTRSGNPAPAATPASAGATATGASAAAAGRPLTEDEAGRLAVARFRNYQDTGVQFSTTVPTPQGDVPLHGYVDYRLHLGFTAASLTEAGKLETAAVQWNGTQVMTWLGVGDGVTPPTAVPAATTAPRALQPSAAALDTVLALLLSLGNDRPDNAQLLQQTDAEWLRSDRVGTTPVDVFAGPSADGAAVNQSAAPQPSAVRATGRHTTRFWVDATGRLLRFEADLASGPVVIDLSATGFHTFAASSLLRS